MMSKKEFELHAAASIAGGVAQKDGQVYHTNLTQDMAQQLADAYEKRGFFEEEGKENPDRYKSPQPRRRDNAAQMVVNEE